MLSNLISKFKKPSNDLVFYTPVTPIMKMYPIEPMSKVKFDWVPKVLQEFKQAQEIPHPVPYTTIRKCPAVFDILKTGYIVRLPYDIHIDITHTPEFEFRWTIKSERLKDISLVPNLVDSQNPIAGHRRPHSADSVLKFSLPWRCNAPKGIKILHSPIPYSDTYDIESCIGVWDPEQSPQLNVQAWVNHRESSFTILAGTPICHLIPITDQKLNLVVREPTQKDIEWIHLEDYYISHKLHYDHKATKELYREHYYGK